MPVGKFARARAIVSSQSSTFDIRITILGLYVGIMSVYRPGIADYDNSADTEVRSGLSKDD